MRKKTLSAAVLCAATVIGVSGLSVTSAAAAEPTPRPKADFNGDGYADLAVGVPGATVGGKAKAGYVNVVWGGKNGLGKHGSATVSQDSAGVPGHAEKDDGFGYAVRPADMNGDGITDIVVGTPDEDNGTQLSAGTVTVLWGSKSGIKGGFTAATGEYSSERLGALLTTGDFDGDKDQDIVLNRAGEESSGVALRPGPVKEGSPSGLKPITSWHFNGPVAVTSADFDADGRDDLAVSYGDGEITGTDVLSHPDAGTRPWKERWSIADYSHSLAAGDFDGDGTVDLALGNIAASSESDGDNFCPDTLGGSIATAYGKRGTTLGGPTSCTNQGSPGVGGEDENGDAFGSRLAVANLDRDGIDELIAGSESEAVGSAKKAGSYWVLASTGPGKPFAGPSISQNSAGVPGTAEAGDRFGAAVATGDFNGDGYPDTAVGAPGEDASKGGVWYARTPKDGPNPAQVSLTPGKLGLSGAHKYGSVLGR
ncbi:FG-GAP and VCBS repeat-containing protein [Streptomyces sp. NRRL B-1347]|uniref:FG-GAP and VCBS repeat-containing protein n=1 Tax=Streptomyces sp. NRRL B-1347 TaxID=1476877 RepID=UPI0004CA831F|nr:FG-GAP and VCBS repeat-containing protein [Streptomyces sp. NRRL B-1347]